MDQATITKMDQALAHLKAGGMVVVVDDENRENEGDLICPAATVTAEQVNFMVRFGRGLVCLALPPEQIRHLELPLMQHEKAPGDEFGTAFTYTIDAKHGVTTGISAADRALTIRLATSPETRSSDIVVPGHVFPLQAKAGGVLERPGHTEAAVDLTRMAGLVPGGVICEIMNDDGTMMRLPDLKIFAETHQLPMISIEQLIAYRRYQDIKPVVETKLPTFGAMFDLKIYHDSAQREHVLLTLGDLSSGAPLVRLHSECLTGDVLGSCRCDCGPQLEKAMETIVADGAGVFIYLRQEGRGIGLTEKIKAYALQDKGLDTVEANVALGHGVDLRDYDVAVRILKDLGLTKVRLLSNNPDKVEHLRKNGFDVERVPLIVKSNPYNQKYFEVKADKLGHYLLSTKSNGTAT